VRPVFFKSVRLELSGKRIGVGHLVTFLPPERSEEDGGTVLAKPRRWQNGVAADLPPRIPNQESEQAAWKHA
jgi:hypothetical protein